MIRTANRHPRNRQLGNAADLFRSVAGAATTGAQIIIKSNVTPDIKIDIGNLLKPGPGIPPQTAVQSDNVTLMKLIKPEVIITGLGLEKSIAPYGKPTTGMFTVVAIGVGVAAALGGLMAWKICRGGRATSSRKRR